MVSPPESKLNQNKQGNRVRPVVISDPINIVVMNVAVVLTSNSLQVASEFGPNIKHKLQAEVMALCVI